MLLVLIGSLSLKLNFLTECGKSIMDMDELEEIMKALDSQRGILVKGFTLVSLCQVCKVKGFLQGFRFLALDNMMTFLYIKTKGGS